MNLNRNLKLSRHFNQAGLSLMELTVVVGLIGVLAFGSAGLISGMTKTKAMAKTSLDMASLTSLALYSTNNSASCSSNLSLLSNPILLDTFKQPDPGGGFLPINTTIYTGSGASRRVLAGVNAVFGSIKVTSVAIRLTSSAPTSTSLNGSSTYLATVQLRGVKLAGEGGVGASNATSANLYGQTSIESTPIYLSISTDTTGKTVIACSSLASGNELPNCAQMPGTVLGTVDGRNLSCVPVPPAPPSGFDEACAYAGGYTVTVTRSNGSRKTMCRVNGSSCPSNMNQVDSWTSTQPSQCWGGSTTGCNGGGTCTTGWHGWRDASPEWCLAPQNVACGPATSGGTNCYAQITAIGCSF